MKPPGALKVAELRGAMERLLTAIEEQIGPEIEFPVDFYWNVPNSAAYQVGAKPELDVGSVVDDVQSVSTTRLSPSMNTRRSGKSASTWRESFGPSPTSTCVDRGYLF